MKKLALEYYSIYFPYKVLGISPTGNKFYLSTGSNMLGKGIENRCIETFINDEYKLILRPLSDLTKEIEHNGDFICIYEELELNKRLSVNDFKDIKYWIDYLPYGIVKELHKYHFDTYGLIEAGLAIDINELNK